MKHHTDGIILWRGGAGTETKYHSIRAVLGEGEGDGSEVSLYQRVLQAFGEDWTGGGKDVS